MTGGLRADETILEYLHRASAGKGVRPKGNTILLSRISRYRCNPTNAEAISIAKAVADHPDADVRVVATQILEAINA